MKKNLMICGSMLAVCCGILGTQAATTVKKPPTATTAAKPKTVKPKAAKPKAVKPKPKATPKATPRPTPQVMPMTMPTEPPPNLNDPAVVTEQLFRGGLERTEFNSMLDRGRKLAVPEGVLLEADLLSWIRSEDLEAVAGFLPKLQEYQGHYQAKESKLFSSPETLQGMILALQGLTNWQQGKLPEFEVDMKNAFWTAPDLSQLFGDWLREYRRQQAMAKLTFAMDSVLDKPDGGTVKFQELLGNHKAMLLDFWASWCVPCRNAIPGLPAKSVALEQQGVVLVGINTERDAKMAKMVQTNFQLSFPWMVEPADLPISHLLMVDTLPRAVLISADGKVLYNGHPEGHKLQTILAQLAPPAPPAKP